MPPQVHAPYLRLWAAETGVPILSVDYGKAPEFPYPWALEECFDAYRSVVESNGGVIGLAGWSGSGSRNKKKKPIRIAIAGDSAGGNLAVATVYKILEFGGHYLPPPSGVLLTYPALSFEMAAWMPEDEIQLLRAESRKAVAEGRKAVNGNGNHKGGEKGKTVPGPPVMGTAAPGSSKEAGDGLGTSDLRRKRTLSFVERRYKFGPGLLTALADADAEPPVQTTRAVVPSRSATELRSLLDSPVVAVSPRRRKTGTPPPPPEPELPPVVQPPSFADRLWGLWDSLLLFRAAPSTRVAPPPATHKTVQMTSRMAFSGDKVLPPEIVRSLALLYVGNSPVPPDFGSDYMLNPNVAPDDLLARFPKVYLICGEKDPMVDDTVVFAGRVREAKVRAHREWRKLVDEEEAAAKQQHDGQGGLASGGRGRRWKASDLSRHVFAREPEEMVHTRILGGMSHGWLNLMGLLPEAKGIAGLNAGWLLDLLAQDDKTPRFPPFPGFAKTSGRDALACEELTEELMRRMESEDGGTIQGLVEVPARPGYYASVPAQIHRFSNPEASRGAVHGKKVLEKWEKQAGDMGVLDESSEGEDMEEKAGEVAAIRATAAAAQAMQARAAKRASVTRSKLLLNPGDESEESSDDDAPIVMRTIKPASSLVYPTAAAAEAELDAVSDAELIKRRKEEVEHALTHFHLNKGDDHRP